MYSAIVVEPTLLSSEPLKAAIRDYVNRGEALFRSELTAISSFCRSKK